MAAEPRVLVVTPDFPPARGGIQVLLHRLVHNWRRVRVRVLTLDQDGSGAFDDGSGLDIRRVGGSGGLRRASIAVLNARIPAEALRFRPDVVVSAHIVTSPGARMARRVRRVPVVQYLYALEMGARPGLAASAVQWADAIVAISEHTRGLAIAAGADPGRIQCIPPGVDLPERVERAPTERPTIITVAQILQRYKGHDVLTRALPLIEARVPEVEWIVIGDGPFKPQLAELVRAQRLDGQVRLVGTVSDAERDACLDRAHVFAMPSRVPATGVGGEGFGITYLEAGAHGLPVVGGDVGGTRDAVVDGETGLLVDPNDNVAVADAIADLLLDPERARRLGQAGAARAQAFAWPLMAARVEDLILELSRSATWSARQAS
jgi:phosphatidylinositol alpha-1,6-mannosyltransferase